MTQNRTKKIILGCTALAVITLGAVAFQKSPWGSAAAQMPGGEMPAMPVPVIKAEEKPVQIWKSFSGRLMAVDYVEIRPQVSGNIEKVHFSDGQIVKKGDVLFTIDQKPYQAAVNQAQAVYSGAKNDEAYAQQEFARSQELLKSGAISKQGFDERTNQLKNNKANINAAYAALKSAQVNLDRSTIRAPIDGRISRPEITQGNLVKAENAPLLTTIVSDKEIYGDFEVDEETYLAFVRSQSGQSVESEQAIPVKLSLSNDAKEYQGKIKSFDNKINPSTGTIRARAVFANEDNALLPGMFANVLIGSSGTDSKITVPEKAVLTDQSRKFVYVITDGAATYREVKLGATTNHERVVESGLAVGDLVIIDNLMKIRPGAKVQGMSQAELDAMKAQMAAGAQAGAPASEKASSPEAAEKPEAPKDTPAKDAPAAKE